VTDPPALRRNYAKVCDVADFDWRANLCANLEREGQPGSRSGW